MGERRGRGALRRWVAVSAAVVCGVIGAVAPGGLAARAAAGTAAEVDAPAAGAAAPAVGGRAPTAEGAALAAEGDVPATDWNLDAAKAAVLSGPISSVPGSPARMDEEAVTAALASTGMRVLTLPFEPVDRDAASESGRQRIDLEDWAEYERDIELIVVEGYQVHFSIYTISPDSLPEAEPILARGDVTAHVLFAIDYLKSGERPEDGPPPPESPRAPADPRVVDEIASAISDAGVYAAPGVYLGTGPTTWTAGDDLAVRAAFLPTVDDDALLPDLLTPLQQRFPDDVVVVVHGRYLEASGPAAVADPVRGSVLWTYGTYAGPLLGWAIAMPRVVSAFAERMALLRTGVVSEQTPPADPADVVGNARAALPWIFGAVAVLIAAGVAARPLLGRRRVTRQEAAAAGAAETQTRRALSVELVDLSRQLLGIEPLAVDGPARRQVDSALERYRVARETLGRDGDVRVVKEALSDARASLRAAGRALGVPLAGAGADAQADDDARAAGDAQAARGERHG